MTFKAIDASEGIKATKLAELPVDIARILLSLSKDKPNRDGVKSIYLKADYDVAIIHNLCIDIVDFAVLRIDENQPVVLDHLGHVVSSGLVMFNHKARWSTLADTIPLQSYFRKQLLAMKKNWVYYDWFATNAAWIRRGMFNPPHKIYPTYRWRLYIKSYENTITNEDIIWRGLFRLLYPSDVPVAICSDSWSNWPSIGPKAIYCWVREDKWQDVKEKLEFCA